jgi:hypothetical protein
MYAHCNDRPQHTAENSDIGERGMTNQWPTIRNIIPAQPGWFMAQYQKATRAFDYEAILAWAIEASFKDAGTVVHCTAITANGDAHRCWFDDYHHPGYAIGIKSPDGQIDFFDGIYENEEKAIEACAKAAETIKARKPKLTEASWKEPAQ